MARNNRRSIMGPIIFGFAMIAIMLGGAVLFLTQTLMKLDATKAEALSGVEELISSSPTVIEAVGEVTRVVPISEDSGLKIMQANELTSMELEATYLVEGTEGKIWCVVELVGQNGKWTIDENRIRVEETISGAMAFRAANRAHDEGDYEMSEELWKISYKGGRRLEGITAYNVGCALSRQGKTDEALEWISRGVDEGYYSSSFFEFDSDLDNLRDTDGYEKLMARVHDLEGTTYRVSSDDDETSPVATTR